MSAYARGTRVSYHGSLTEYHGDEWYVMGQSFQGQYDLRHGRFPWILEYVSRRSITPVEVLYQLHEDD